MTEEPVNLTHQYLKRIDLKLDRLMDDVHDLKVRMTTVEEGLAGVHRRLDRIDVRLSHVEKRLDLVEA